MSAARGTTSCRSFDATLHLVESSSSMQRLVLLLEERVEFLEISTFATLGQLNRSFKELC